MGCCYVFNKTSGTMTNVDLTAALDAANDKQNVVWINLFQPTADELAVLKESLNLHELTIEDLESFRVRPKVEEFDDHLYIVFKALNFKEGAEEIDRINLNLLLFKNILITSYLEPIDSITQLVNEIPNHPAVMQKGADFFLYVVLDRVVDDYFPFMDELDEATDKLEGEIFEKFNRKLSAEIFGLKLKVTHLRRLLGPKREMLNNLISRPHPLINPKTQVYLRDVYDHIIRINDYLETYREILQGAMDSYLTQMSNRMNDIMKTLSAVATTMLPLGIIAGIYGTNFKVLPGSEGPHSFWLFMAVMGLVFLSTLLYFKRKKWF